MSQTFQTPIFQTQRGGSFTTKYIILIFAEKTRASFNFLSNLEISRRFLLTAHIQIEISPCAFVQNGSLLFSRLRRERGVTRHHFPRDFRRADASTERKKRALFAPLRPA